ncbi:MAG: amino acid--tRNA ligase-related protein [Candidatus Babeliales bacterium]
MNQQAITTYHTLEAYHTTVQKLRRFFFARNFIEVDTQSRLSILAACEDPKTIATFILSGIKWPLPQTGQMWLEHEMLKNPTIPGFFCLTTSYRDEPQPNNRRHLKIFPLFEFETHGDVTVLQKLMLDLLTELGFDKTLFQEGNYQSIAQKYQTKILDTEHEERIMQDFGSLFFLKKFPQYTHPFFNMKKNDALFNKIDAILYGVETIGAAERSTNVDEMQNLFHTISNGEYAQTLYSHFGKERVDKEVNAFLSHDFFPRSGGGIGVTRLMRALDLAKQDMYSALSHQSSSQYQQRI